MNNAPVQRQNYAYNTPQQPQMYSSAPQQPQMYSSAPQQPQMYSAPSPAQPQYNQNLKCRTSSKGDMKSVLLKNVVVPSHVDVVSDTLRFARDEIPDSSGRMHFSFKPDGNTHTVSVYNSGRLFKTFVLKPQNIEVESHPEERKTIVLSNVYNMDNVKLASTGLIQWSLEENPEEKHSYLLRFEPHPDTPVQKIEISRVDREGNRTVAENGRIQLSPRDPALLQPMAQQQPNYSAPVYQPYQQPTTYAPPPMQYNAPQPMYHNQGPPNDNIGRSITSRKANPI